MSNHFSLYAQGVCRLCGGSRNNHLAGCDGELLDALGWGLLRSGTREAEYTSEGEYDWHAFDVAADRASLLDGVDPGDACKLYRVLVAPPEDVHAEVVAAWDNARRALANRLRSLKAKIAERGGDLERMRGRVDPDVWALRAEELAVWRAAFARDRAELEALRGQVEAAILDLWLSWSA